MTQFNKDEQDSDDFSIDWSAELDTGETLSESEWTVEDGVDILSSDLTDTVTTVLVSGGTAGTSYHFYNKVTTSNGRILRRYITIAVRPISA